MGSWFRRFMQCGKNDILRDGSTVPEQEVRRLYVDATFQNRGIGARLMAAALALPDLQEAAAIVLDVWEHNPQRSASMRAMALWWLVRAGLSLHPVRRPAGTRSWCAGCRSTRRPAEVDGRWHLSLRHPRPLRPRIGYLPSVFCPLDSWRT